MIAGWRICTDVCAQLLASCLSTIFSGCAGEINKKNGWNVGIHVDGASGAFVAPFMYPDLVWDFRLPNVVSVNASGHKCAACCSRGLQAPAEIAVKHYLQVV